MRNLIYFIPATLITLGFVLYDGLRSDSEAALHALGFLYVVGGIILLVSRETK
jgi:hypothetical protein